MEYICKKCNNKTYGNVKSKDKHIGLYCTNCNSWIKWLSKAEYEEYKKEHNSSSQVKVDANNYDNAVTVPSSIDTIIDTIYQIDNVPPLDLDSFAFYCYPMHRDCEFAKPSGECKSAQCHYQGNSVSAPSESLPDEITLNGIVYIKKSLITERR